MSDFGQQQDFGEDGTRKEGGGRGAKFKSFMAGTKNVSSFLLTNKHTYTFDTQTHCDPLSTNVS